MKYNKDSPIEFKRQKFIIFEPQAWESKAPNLF